MYILNVIKMMTETAGKLSQTKARLLNM